MNSNTNDILTTVAALTAADDQTTAAYYEAEAGLSNVIHEAAEAFAQKAFARWEKRHPNEQRVGRTENVFLGAREYAEARLWDGEVPTLADFFRD